MKTLLRSCFIADKADKKELILRNFLNFQQAGLGFEDIEDNVIWNFIEEFVRAHNHVPEVATLQAAFTHRQEDQVLDRLESIRSLPARNEGDFKSYLENKAEERRKRLVATILKEAASIVSTGLEIQDGPNKKDKKLLKGPQEAIKYILDRGHEIVTPTFGAKLSGEVTSDGEDFIAEYNRVEMDPTSGVGQWTGLAQMDNVLNGAKRSELWTHAAYTGGMKSTWTLNWAYNQAVYGNHDSLFFSLEMPYIQVRRMLVAMHSFHEKFRPIRHKLGLQKTPAASVGLPYEAIRDAKLGQYHPAAKDFLVKYVIPDLKNPINNYGRIRIEVADPDKADFTVAELRQRAEMYYSKHPFATCFIDHMGLMAPRKWVSSTTERLNEVIRDLKRMAMGFNRGAGLAVVGLFQIGREGYKNALKRKEKTGQSGYDLTALSYSNECERSSDIVTTSWIDDELIKANRVQFQCLKSRDNAKFETFLARVEWPCRRLLTCTDLVLTPKDKAAIGDAIDKAGQLLDL